MQIMLRFGAPQPSVVAWVPRHLMHKYRRWYNVVHCSGGFLKCIVWIIWIIWKRSRIDIYVHLLVNLYDDLFSNDASVTAEHHACEFFNSLYVLLVLVNSRPANCDSLVELSQSSTSTKLLSVFWGMLEMLDFLCLQVFWCGYRWFFLRCKLFCE